MDTASSHDKTLMKRKESSAGGLVNLRARGNAVLRAMGVANGESTTSQTHSKGGSTDSPARSAILMSSSKEHSWGPLRSSSRQNSWDAQSWGQTHPSAPSLTPDPEWSYCEFPQDEPASFPGSSVELHTAAPQWSSPNLPCFPAWVTTHSQAGETCQSCFWESKIWQKIPLNAPMKVDVSALSSFGMCPAEPQTKNKTLSTK